MNLFHGHGKLTMPDNQFYSGNWENGFKSGLGKIGIKIKENE